MMALKKALSDACDERPPEIDPAADRQTERRRQGRFVPPSPQKKGGKNDPARTEKT